MHVDKFGAFGQQWATRLTLDIVDVADSLAVEAAVPVLADCSTVLSAVPPLGPRMLTPPDPMRPVESEKTLAGLPSMRVPALSAVATKPAPQRPSAPSELESDLTHERLEFPPTAQESIQPAGLPQGSNWIPEWATRPKPTVAMPLPSLGSGPVLAGSDALVDVPSPEEQARMMESLRSLETRNLLEQLQDTDPFKIAAIRAVLVERGIAAEELALATRLCADDLAERLKLVDDLKVLPARTARRWLRELLADKDAEVRLSALTALATTNDPELPSIARDLAVRDADHRVAELAAQIMREMR
jgi:hypothetical protein